MCCRFCGNNTQLLPYRRGPPCCLFVHRESIHVFSRTWQLVSYTYFCKSACACAKCKVVWICTCTICAQKCIINTLTLELNSQCNLQNSGLKFWYLIFFMQTLIKENKQNQKETIPTGLHKNGRNWLMHRQCHLGIKPNILWCSIYIAQCQRVK